MLAYSHVYSCIQEINELIKRPYQIHACNANNDLNKMPSLSNFTNWEHVLYYNTFALNF